MQGKFAHVVDDGVPGVTAALISHHHIVLCRQVIHHAALALVTPVNPYDRAICHIYSLLFCVIINNSLLYAQRRNK